MFLDIVAGPPHVLHAAMKSRIRFQIQSLLANLLYQLVYQAFFKLGSCRRSQGTLFCVCQGINRGGRFSDKPGRQFEGPTLWQQSRKLAVSVLPNQLFRITKVSITSERSNRFPTRIGEFTEHRTFTSASALAGNGSSPPRW
jgi:hypothetical protein